jgi:hypothetical protein
MLIDRSNALSGSTASSPASGHAKELKDSWSKLGGHPVEAHAFFNIVTVTCRSCSVAIAALVAETERNRTLKAELLDSALLENATLSSFSSLFWSAAIAMAACFSAAAPCSKRSRYSPGDASNISGEMPLNEVATESAERTAPSSLV